MSKIDKIKKHYQPRIVPGRANFDVLDWAGPDTQQARFAILTEYVDFSDNSSVKTLLDVGCGLGDLVGFLKHHHLKVNYTGVDILEEMLIRAREAHPAERFVQADIFGDESALAGEVFDVVYCSGALNLNLGNNMEFIKTALPRMLSHAGEFMVVNFLHSRAPVGDPNYFAYRPEEVVEIIQPLCKRIRLVDEYLPNDFTLICEPKTGTGD